MPARSPQRQQLMGLLGPVVAAQGYDLEDVSVTAAGRRSLIRITVDGDHGIDLDGIAAVSRAISEALDEDSADEAAFAGPYVLEVSSPGVERPLIEPRHWRRAVGRLVSVSASDVALSGRVVAADDATVVLSIDGDQRRLPLADLGAGRIQVEFAHPDGLDFADEDGSSEPGIDEAQDEFDPDSSTEKEA